ncbi:hypothetical protein KWL13_014090 [Clostridioides difficile]|nr:hypothetical protein [Clostridioides difficile]EGT5471325.1 hypothetical protein [Clostridioides difficile]MBY2079294.1 hypothetical protein [Clostridioides difficile]MBY2094739.1 hypothetical protein [Clostridioides difficile]MBY2112099.1 hypothetical protein [Clostridioides difficile]
MLNTSTFISTIIAFIVGILVNSLAYEIQVPFWLFSGYIIFSLICFWFLLIKINNKSSSTFDLSDIELIKFIHNSHKDQLSCILKSCPYINRETLLTLFYIEDDLERYFATGKVINIQSNGLIHITILDLPPEYLLNDIHNNNIKLINSIIIKPIVTQTFLSERSI